MNKPMNDAHTSIESEARMAPRLPRAVNGFLLLSALIASACTSIPNLEVATQSLANAKPCCTSLAALPFKDLAANTPKSLVIDTGAPAYQFDDGLHYFSALRLPEARTADQLSVSTFLSSGILPAATVLMPQFLALDSAFHKTRLIEEYSVEQVDDFMRGGFWRINLRLQPEERYIVIYSKPISDRIGSLYYNRDSGYAAGAIYVPASTTSHLIRWSPMGELSVQLH
jgi:maltose operon protein